MTQVVLDIGNCGPDHAGILRMLNRWFDVTLLRAHELRDALELLRTNTVDLILVNRKLDIDYSDGMEIIKALKSDVQYQTIPVMLITNYPEHQAAAIELGAEPGFGKLELDRPTTLENLKRFLTAKSV